MKTKLHFCVWLIILVSLACSATETNAESVEDEIEWMITRGQLEPARKKLESLGDAGHSQSTRANFLYAQCLIFAGRFDEAEPILKRCAQAEDTDYRRTPYHAANMLRDLPLMKKKRAEVEQMNRFGYTGLVIKEGNIVELVVKKSSAENAGIQPGDKLLEIDGSPVPKDYEQTVKMVRGPAGSSVALVFERDGKRLNFKLTRASNLSEMNKNTFRIEGRFETLKHLKQNESQ